MSVSAYSSACIHCWAWQEALRRLGFRSDNIFVFVDFTPGARTEYDQELFVSVMLKIGEKKFVVPQRAPLGTKTMSDFKLEWTHFCAELQSGALGEEELLVKYHEVLSGNLKLLLVSKLLSEGFAPLPNSVCLN